MEIGRFNFLEDNKCGAVGRTLKIPKEDTPGYAIFTTHIPGCSAGRFNPANPYGLASSPQSRVIGDCDGDVIIENMTYMLDTTVPKSQLSELYGIAQQKVFFYGVGVLILGTWLQIL